MRIIAYCFAFVFLATLCTLCLNYAYPNSIYRINHPAKDTIVAGQDVTGAIKLLGHPYELKTNETGGQTLMYRTMIDWDKFVEFRTLTIETDENGMIVNVTSANDE